MSLPKDLAHKYFPGMGEQYEIGAQNLGVSVIDCTITLMNGSAQTDAQLIASPPNTDTTVNACGPIVHSLGATPTFAMLQRRSGSMGTALVFAFITADHSAVYFRASAFTTDAKGYAVRAVVVR